MIPEHSEIWATAGWKPAIRQVGNLRYQSRIGLAEPLFLGKVSEVWMIAFGSSGPGVALIQTLTKNHTKSERCVFVFLDDFHPFFLAKLRFLEWRLPSGGHLLRES